MPLKEYLCRDCGFVFEELINAENPEPTACHQCEGTIETLVSAPGGYHIQGNNSASVRPKQAGCFVRKIK